MIEAHPLHSFHDLKAGRGGLFAVAFLQDPFPDGIANIPNLAGNCSLTGAQNAVLNLIPGKGSGSVASDNLAAFSGRLRCLGCLRGGRLVRRFPGGISATLQRW